MRKLKMHLQQLDGNAPPAVDQSSAAFLSLPPFFVFPLSLDLDPHLCIMV